MKSPFPGMDPYLERHWEDVHARLILYACDQLEDQLPGNLIARVEERVVLEVQDVACQCPVYPDVKILEKAGRRSVVSGARGRSGVMEPLVSRYRPEPATETFINILDPTNRYRVVTVIEILNLANKLPGDGQRQYRQKQQELYIAQVSLVEIDLLRKGKRVFCVPEAELPWSTYQACVRRGWDAEQVEVYSMSLRKPLPTIKIPLRKKEDDIFLDLRVVLDQVYRKGRYGTTINYQRPPQPPLKTEDAKWAKALLRKARRR